MAKAAEVTVKVDALDNSDVNRILGKHNVTIDGRRFKEEHEDVS